MLIQKAMAIILTIGACCTSLTVNAEEGIDWSTPAFMDFDNGAPGNFLRLNGFSGCGTSALAFLAEDTKSLTIRDLQGNLVGKVDLSSYFRTISGPLAAQIVCGTSNRSQIGVMIYSGNSEDGEHVDYSNVVSVVFDFSAKRPSKLLPMVNLFSGNQLWGVSKQGYIYAFSDLQEPEIVGSMRDAQDGIDFGNLLRIPADRFIVAYERKQFVCFAARYRTKGDRVQCAALDQVSELLKSLNVEYPHFISVVGSSILAQGPKQLLSCDLGKLTCVQYMNCDCSMDDVGYAVSSDDVVYQTRAHGMGVYGNELPQADRYIQLHTSREEAVYRVPIGLVGVSEYVEVVTAGDAAFLVLFLQEGSTNSADGMSVSGRLAFKRIH